MRQQERERRYAQDGDPYHVLTANAVAYRSANEGGCRNGEQEDEQVQLRALYRNVELIYQVESVVVGHARHVKILGEDQHQQYHQGKGHLACGKRYMNTIRR